MKQKTKNKTQEIKQKTQDTSYSELTSYYKLEYVKWFFVLLSATLVYLVIAELILNFYHPDISSAIEYAKKVSMNYSPKTFLPKPTERLLFVSAVFVFTISIFLFYYLANKYIRTLKEKPLQAIYYASIITSAGIIILISYLGLMAANPFATDMQNSQDMAAKTNLDFYFISTFIYNNFYLFVFIIFPIILFNFLYKFKLSEKTNLIIDKTKGVFVYGFCILLIIVIFLMSSFHFPYTYENKYDFNAVYYSVVQVYNGLPMLVDNFTNTYGLYPHFVVPILKLFGLSVLSFSTLMAFLIAVCYVFVLLFLRKMVSNKLLILFGFTTILYNYYFYVHTITNFDASFSGLPIRSILPSGLIIFAIAYLKNRPKTLYYMSFFIFSFGILWNPEFGIVTYLSLIAFYSYLELSSQQFKVSVKKIIYHILTGLGILAITLSLYSIIIKIFYGSFPALTYLLSTAKVFSIIGFNMLPMPTTFHPWMLFAITFLIGLLNTIHHIITKNISSRSAIIFLLTIIGIQTFSYYEGRSHNWTLIVVYQQAFLLLTIFADDLLKIIKKQKIFIVPFALIAFILSFSLFQTIYDYKKITELIYENDNKAQNQDENNRIIENGNFIKNLTTEKEKILILTANQYYGLYYGMTKTTAAVNPGFMELFFKTDYERILSFLIKNKSTKIFFEPEAFRFNDSRIPVILSSLYNIAETNGKVLLLSKKRENASETLILKQDKNDIYHEQPENNLSNRLKYSNGEKGKITLGKQFSIEIIFRPKSTPKSVYTNWSTLLTNAKDKTGFVLQQRDTSRTQYVFAIHNEGIVFTVAPDKWNYLSIEVNNNKIKSYENGQLLGIQDVNTPYQESEGNLYIGNYNTLAGFYFGDIKEIKISNSPLDEKEMKSEWEKISSLVIGH